MKSFILPCSVQSTVTSDMRRLGKTLTYLLA